MTPGSSNDERIAVGRITRAHGVHGEVAVLILTEVESRFEPGSVLWREGALPLTVEATRPHRGKLLVKFEEIPDRTEAERIVAAYLFVPSEDVPAAPEGAWWPHQLEGCEVVTDTGRELGPIREILQAPANDIWVAGGAEAEVLIPALKDVVIEVDVQARKVVVRDIPGLTTPA